MLELSMVCGLCSSSLYIKYHVCKYKYYIMIWIEFVCACVVSAKVCILYLPSLNFVLNMSFVFKMPVVFNMPVVECLIWFVQCVFFVIDLLILNCTIKLIWAKMHHQGARKATWISCNLMGRTRQAVVNTAAHSVRSFAQGEWAHLRCWGFRDDWLIRPGERVCATWTCLLPCAPLSMWQKFTWNVIRLGLKKRLGPPGATTASNCSLCRAGTYWTGSGQAFSFGLECFVNLRVFPDSTYLAKILLLLSCKSIDSYC